MGGYVRRVARNSLKYSTGHAAAGQPPFVHQFFTRQKKDRKTGPSRRNPCPRCGSCSSTPGTRRAKSTVVGPVKFNSLSKTKATTGGTIPGVLERGGGIQQAKIVVVPPGAHRTEGDGPPAGRLPPEDQGRVDRPAEAAERVEIKRATIKPHPYMAPALARSLPVRVVLRQHPEEPLSGTFKDTAGGLDRSA
jgi:hypothetical protein